MTALVSFLLVMASCVPMFLVTYGWGYAAGRIDRKQAQLDAELAELRGEPT